MNTFASHMQGKSIFNLKREQLKKFHFKVNEWPVYQKIQIYQCNGQYHPRERSMKLHEFPPAPFKNQCYMQIPVYFETNPNLCHMDLGKENRLEIEVMFDCCH